MSIIINNIYPHDHNILLPYYNLFLFDIKKLSSSKTNDLKYCINDWMTPWVQISEAGWLNSLQVFIYLFITYFWIRNVEKIIFKQDFFLYLSVYIFRHLTIIYNNTYILYYIDIDVCLFVSSRIVPHWFPFLYDYASWSHSLLFKVYRGTFLHSIAHKNKYLYFILSYRLI